MVHIRENMEEGRGVARGCASYSGYPDCSVNAFLTPYIIHTIVGIVLSIAYCALNATIVQPWPSRKEDMEMRTNHREK